MPIWGQRGRVSDSWTAEGWWRGEQGALGSVLVSSRLPPVRWIVQLDATCWVTETRRSHEFI
jgi:hypothetical protein